MRGEATIEEQPHTEPAAPKEPAKEREMHPEIAELKKPMQRLLEQLRERIDRGDYQLIIGDDASGRIPARIMHWVMQEVYKEKGFAGPDIRFFAGSGRLDGLGQQIEKFKKIENFLEVPIIDIKYHYDNNIPVPNALRHSITHVLIVTESIQTGIALLPLTAALRKQGINCDVATVGLDWDATDEFETVKEATRELSQRFEGNIYYGFEGTPNIHRAYYLSGVEKLPHSLFSHRSKDGTVDPEEDLSAQYVGEAREDAKKIADELVEWYRASQMQNAKVKDQK